MTYRFRPWQELGWAVAVAGATVLLIELVGLEPDAITDVQSWAVALGAAMVRSMAGAALDFLRRSVVQNADPVIDVRDAVLALSPAGRARLIRLVELEAQRE
jgi:hypothetical protein